MPYYWHLAQGQLDVLSNCEPIQQFLQSDTVSIEVRNKLELIQETRLFAHSQIGLLLTDNYTCFHDTEGLPVSWNVSACATTRFEPYTWQFPIVGKLTYKGFFEEQLAVTEQIRLAAEGFDVLLRPVSAYSTLGYFTDPVLSTMLNYSDVRLADLIIHELTHGTVFAKGFTDFNESLANFVGNTGSIMFIKSRGVADEVIQKIVDEREDDRKFREFINKVVADLDSLYTSTHPDERILRERASIFRSAQSRFNRLRGNQFTTNKYDFFLRWKINNAQLLSYRRYNRDFELFERLYESEGLSLSKMVQVCQGCENQDNPWDCLRKKLNVGAAG